MAATARMILQVDPAEKARWTAEARKAGISTSEFVRRAAAEHDPDLVLSPEDGELLRLMAAEVTAAAARMAEKLDAMSASLAEFHDPDRTEKMRAQARRELEASGERLDLDKLRAIFHQRAQAA